MKISVIIPARDAEATIAEAIQSLQAQSHSDWEAIVVDDGSTDGTANMVNGFASVDSRISLVLEEPQGVSAARNRGLEEASADWILFLDADDWIRPTHMKKMIAVLEGDPGLAGVYCGYSRMTEDGVVIEGTIWWDPANVFHDLARNCLWAIHACIVRKSIVLEVGGFVPGWRTCEDWDLWLRIARTGARFGVVYEMLAIYRVRKRSASMDGVDMARGSIALVNLGHGPDPRVTSPKREYADGVSSDLAPVARFAALAWPAGLMMACGEEATTLLDLIESHDRAPTLDPHELTISLFESMILPDSLPRSAWVDMWAVHSDRIARFLSALEERSGATELARRTLRLMEQMALSYAPPHRSVTIGSTRSVALEATSPILDLKAGNEVERVAIDILLEGEPTGKIYLPVCDGQVVARVIADTIASELTWHFLVPYMEETMFRDGGSCRTPAVRVGRKAVRVMGRLLSKKKSDFEQWANSSMYEVAVSRELFPSDGQSRSVDADGGRIMLEASHPLPMVRTDGKRLEVIVHLGGEPLGCVVVETDRGEASPAAIRRAVLDACGFEICRVIVRDVVLGNARGRWRPIVEALRRNAESRGWKVGRFGSTRRSLPEYESDRMVIGRRAELIGTSASRYAVLPAGARDDVLSCALASGESIVNASRERPSSGCVYYSPGVMNAEGAMETTGTKPLLTASGTRRAFDIASRLVERSFPSIREKLGSSALADRLPVLMYHRIGEGGPEELAPYRVSPTDFEEQLRHLKDRGYYSVTPEEWHAARDRRKQLRGRPVLFTFDDGSEDFFHEAWPLLQKYGFGAIVFLVAGHVGGTNAWDSAYGDEISLMSWKQILRLHAEGVDFGSHSVNHPPMTALTPEEVVREAVRSREILQRNLNRPVKTFAYPYGDQDPVVSHLIGACGYVYGFTCFPDVARYPDSLLQIPRINVDGGKPVDWIIRKMEFRHGAVAK